MLLAERFMGGERRRYFMLLRFAITIPLLVRAIYTDLKNEKIENRLLFVAMLVGTCLFLKVDGLSVVLNGYRMAVIMILALFLLFLIKGLGAGDIKLLAVLSFYYPDYSVRIVVTAFMLAGGFALLKMLYRGIRRERVFVRDETIHFSIPVAVSVVWVLGMDYLFV